MIYMPSRGRAGKIVTPFPNTPDFKLIVHESEHKAYNKAYPYIPIITHTETDIGAIRQRLINMTHGPFVMVDDDLKLYERNAEQKLRPTDDIDRMVWEIFKWLDLYPQVGISTKAFNNTLPTHSRLNWRCVSFWGVNPRILRRHCIEIPPWFAVQEDVYITLSLARHGYPNMVFSKFAHRGDLKYGGCYEHRTPADMRVTDALLLRDFPELVRVDKRKARKGINAIQVIWSRFPCR